MVPALLKDRNFVQKSVNLIHWVRIGEKLAKIGVMDSCFSFEDNEYCEDIMLEAVLMGIFPQTDEQTLRDVLTNLCGQKQDDEVIRHFMNADSILGNKKL